jgi:N4-gp56 family major capsid protein
MTMTSAEIREAVRTLRRAKVPTFSDGFYHGLIHPDVEYDMMNDADWKTMSQYNGGTASGQNSLIKSSIGDYLGVRWQTSTDAPIFVDAGVGGTVEVYGTFIYGPRWYGTVDLAAYPMPTVNPQNQRGMRVTGVPVDTETKDDPLGQYGVAGWKTSYGAAVLQNFRGLRIESAATL